MTDRRDTAREEDAGRRPELPTGATAPASAVSSGGKRRAGRGRLPALLAAGLLAGATVPAAGAAAGEHAAASNPPGIAAQCQAAVTDRMESVYDDWLGLMERRSALPEETFRERTDSVLESVFALEEMGGRILGDRWSGLDAHRRDEVTDALTHYLRTRLVSRFTETGFGEAPSLSALYDDSGNLRAGYDLTGWSGVESVRLHFAPVAGSSCAVVDVEVDGESLVRNARDRSLPVLEELSFPSMIAELGEYGHVVLEDFEDDSVGTLPRGWDWRDSDDDKNKPYEVRSENGNRYLAARDEGESVILGKEMEWDMSRYPYVSFRVRIHEIPPGGDERYDDRVDSAAGIYFTYRRKMLGLIPESVKYVWSSTLSVGAATKRDGVGRPWQVVFGSGEEGLGEWRTYTFDLRQAYRDTFGGDPPSTPIGVGVLSDANSVGGRAYADYDDIRALRQAPPGVGSGVREILPTP